MFRSALVTGGASGIGAAAVALLEAEGCDVTSLDLATGFDVADATAWEQVGAVDFAFLNAGVATGVGEIAELVQLWESGAVQPVVGAEFALSEASAAHALIEDRGHVGKVVLVP